jgi:hypothetical protein
VDTAAEKLTETVSRQKFTASETTHDNEYQRHAITAEKTSETCVTAGNLARPKNCLSLFLIWVRCVLCRVIVMYVPLFFTLFLTTNQPNWAWA